jgi:hypothetical protein
VDAGRVVDESGSKTPEGFGVAKQLLGVERSALLFFAGRFGAIGAERDGWSSARWSVGPAAFRPSRRDGSSMREDLTARRTRTCARVPSRR